MPPPPVRSATAQVSPRDNLVHEIVAKHKAAQSRLHALEVERAQLVADAREIVLSPEQEPDDLVDVDMQGYDDMDSINDEPIEEDFEDDGVTELDLMFDDTAEAEIEVDYF